MSPEDIVGRWRSRRAAQAPHMAAMRSVQEHYNGDVVYPMPELERNEKAFVANLITQGLDAMGARIGSTLPNVWYPSARPGIKVQDERARDRRLVNVGWWDMNRMKLKMRRRARYYLGYACAPALVRPDFERSIPQWEVLNPLGAYPAPMVDLDELCPDDHIQAKTVTLGWLRSRYPAQAAALVKGAGRDNPDKRFDVLTYYDADETVMVVVGDKPDTTQNNYFAGMSNPSPDGLSPQEELARTPNRAGICPVVFPGRITLDRPMGAFDTILGMHDMQAMLMALELIAVKRSIFPDEWLIARPNEQPVIVTPANGLTGSIGRAKGGVFQTQQINPGFQTQPMIDRLEAGQRRGASIPQEFGGESTSNVRTGRRGDAVMSAAVDMPIQEAQEIFEAALAEENVRAIAVDKAYFGSQAKSFYVGSKGARANVDYVPDDLFADSNFNIVKYASPGSDINQLVTTCGQRVGIGEMSVQTFMEVDPLIEDPEREHGQILKEALEKAQLASLQQAAESSQLPPSDLAEIAQAVDGGNKTLFEAVIAQHAKAQERQAAQAPPPGEGQGAAPGAMPGLAAPGAGAEQQPPPSIGPPPPSSVNLQQLLSTLHQPAQPAPTG